MFPALALRGTSLARPSGVTPASVDVLRGTAARPPLWERAVAAAFWVIAGAIIAALYALRS